MKRLMQCVLAILFVGCFLTMPAFAAEDQEERASDYFIGQSAYLLEVSDTEFEVWFDVKATDKMDELGISAIYVEKSSNGSTWTAHKTFTKSDYSELIDYGTGLHAGYVSCSGTKGYYYRAQVIFYAKKGQNIGKMPIYTYSIRLGVPKEERTA